MTHPKRYLADGTATSTRVRGLQRVTCSATAHAACFAVLTSWAGDTIPRPRWTAHVDQSGAVDIIGPGIGNETPQMRAGIVRRVRSAVQS